MAEERPTSPVAGSSEREAAFESARRDSADRDKDEAEYRDVHRRPTVRRRVFK